MTLSTIRTLATTSGDGGQTLSQNLIHVGIGIGGIDVQVLDNVDDGGGAGGKTGSGAWGGEGGNPGGQGCDGGDGGDIGDGGGLGGGGEFLFKLMVRNRRISMSVVVSPLAHAPQLCGQWRRASSAPQSPAAATSARVGGTGSSFSLSDSYWLSSGMTEGRRSVLRRRAMSASNDDRAREVLRAIQASCAARRPRARVLAGRGACDIRRRAARRPCTC